VKGFFLIWKLSIRRFQLGGDHPLDLGRNIITHQG
jgi:hypothetical protein